MCYFYQIPFVLLHLEWFLLFQMYLMLQKNLKDDTLLTERIILSVKVQREFDKSNT